MSLFDQLVTEAISKNTEFSTLRTVVEKELLHHDILRLLSHNNLLKDLTFIGGTCLRACYGGVRLSEDLDFAGGTNFSKDQLSELSLVLKENLTIKYQLPVYISEPNKEQGNVDTWKIKIETRPGKRDIPTQRINIDICSIKSYEKRPMLLINPYGVDMGTSGLIIQAQSREEIYCDKLLAFALRPNSIKYRDIWDIVWLHQQNVMPNLALLHPKLVERNIALQHYIKLLQNRVDMLKQEKQMQQGFTQEMQRFLTVKQMEQSFQNSDLWYFVVYLMSDLHQKIITILKK